jgi:hypothetical protein
MNLMDERLTRLADDRQTFAFDYKTERCGNVDTKKTRVNPSEETIPMGPTGIGIRFLLTREDTNGSMSVFEVRVPAGQRIPAPSHKNEAYEEILYGIEGVLRIPAEIKVT